MSRWGFVVKISYFLVSMGMISMAYLYTDDLMIWVFNLMANYVNVQMNQILQGVM